MTEQDKTALLERGRDCLSVLRRIFDNAIQAKQFYEANTLFHEYAGAAKMLNALGLISDGDYDVWTEGILSRYYRARYPKAYAGEDS